MSKRYRADEPEDGIVTVSEAREETPQVEVPVPGSMKVKPVVDDREAYIKRKLMVINEWPDGAKKRAAVERLLKRKEV